MSAASQSSLFFPLLLLLLSLLLVSRQLSPFHTFSSSLIHIWAHKIYFVTPVWLQTLFLPPSLRPPPPIFSALSPLSVLAVVAKLLLSPPPRPISCQFPPLHYSSVCFYPLFTLFAGPPFFLSSSSSSFIPPHSTEQRPQCAG